MTPGGPDQFRDAVLDELQWRMIGPHRGGRVVAVAGDGSDPMTFYFGACAGGVWTTTDGGRYWRNVTDGQLSTAAVGALAVSSSHPDVIYAGMGETSIRNDVSHGDGVYRSTDGGRTWTNVGLRETRHIGRILIHPEDPDVLYVAALGHAYGPNPERGVYRSRDGGATWDHVLFKSAGAGSHDIAMDPAHPDVLFASIWQVRRHPHTLDSGGEDSGIWRSVDGGDTWEDVTRNPGLPQGTLGKIGVAMSPARRDRVWALVEAEDSALFRSDDGGDTWTRLSEEPLLRTRPWYYMHVTADPQDPDTVYVQNYSFWKSIDAGATFARIPTPHGDDHALWIDPADNRRMIEGNDGGAAVSFNGGASWSSVYNQPTAQLYHVTTDDAVPYRVYGSQQDNTAISLPSMSLSGSIHEREWFVPGGGESGYIAVKPDDAAIVVASGPAGRRAFNDVMTTFDRRTGQRWNTTVWPELYGWGVGAGDLKYRFQWTFPILFSRHDPDALFVAGNRVFKSTDLGASWDPVSPDLTRNDPDKLLPSGGPITRDNTGAEVYCTVFALAESPVRAGLLWAGSDDGLIHVTDDGGGEWRNVTPPQLPEWALISVIEPSPHDADTAYVAATRYKHDDTRPYLLRTTDRGATWTLITDGIPDDDFTRVIREDPNRRGLLYAGTETGIHISFDGGARWRRLGGNLPVVPVYDLVVKGVEMVVATHGRSFWILDDVTTFHQLGEASGDGPAHLFAPRPTMRIRVQGGMRQQPEPGMTGHGRNDASLVSYHTRRGADGRLATEFLDAGTNPPSGVVVQYHLDASPDEPLELRILDGAGRELRSFSSERDELTTRPGMNRFAWSMRLAGARGITPVDADLAWWERPEGALVLPGDYRVRLTLGGRSWEQPFRIDPDPRIDAGPEQLASQLELLTAIIDRLSATNDAVSRIEALLPQIRSWEARAASSGAGDVGAAANRLVAELEAVRGALIDVHIRGAQLWASGLHEKLNALFDSVDSADKAPPRQARDVFAELSSELTAQLERLERATREGTEELSRAAAEAGMPIVG